jgi:uncharacterized protein (DUF4415 family)
MADAAADADFAQSGAERLCSKPKADLHMRLDRDVLDYFRGTGKGYQTRINAVLRSYVRRMRHD